MANVWRVRVAIKEEDHFVFDEIFSSLDAGIDLSKESEQWVWTAYIEETHSKEKIEEVLSLVSALTESKEEAVIEKVPETDWKEKLKQSFPPLEVGSFFIHSFEEETPEALIGLRIPAGLAFGTGEHPTTASCLRLYDELTEDNTFKTVLDMGCGSAILAMAAARKQKSKCVAVDIDLESVETAKENIKINMCDSFVECICGDGFRTENVQQKKPFDLIFMNILAKPLIEMAADVAHTLKGDGVAILSGFTEDQKEKVEEAYTKQGLTCVLEASEKNWVAMAVTHR